MEKYTFFVGVDISKNTLDFHLRSASSGVLSFNVPNTVQGVKEAIKIMRPIKGLKAGNCLVCMEHTGIYGLFALQVLHAKGFAVWHEVASSIKNGAGAIHRGKNDKVDATRIADYAYTFREKAKLWEPPRRVVLLMADLISLRIRLLGVISQLRVPVNEIKKFKKKGHAETLRLACRKTLAQAEKDIKDLDARILKLINADSELKRIYTIVTSVPHVGFVTAINTIVVTNEFKDINDPRKLACHAGCAPFDHQSGTSIRKRSKVSHKANKRMKSLFHMCACSAIQCKGELQEYFHRKLEQGKCKFVVLNAIRNKIIHRICACVRDDRKFSRIPITA